MTKTKVKLCTYCGKSNQSELPACPKCMMGLAMGTGAHTNAHADDSHIPPVEKLVAAFPGLEIQHLIGHGGMGAVYQARQLNLDRVVALKILSPRLSQDPAFAERFLREARTLAKLSHPNIVTVFDFGQTYEFYFLTMEFVDGVNLRDTISANLLDPAEALAIVPQICDALQYAHDSGVVHRDIKPENILIAKSGSVKIADFGLAKILEPTPEQFTLTGTRQVLGTRNYMAPEQIESPNVVDHRADLYSLGVVFYELLTGELPLGRFALPSEKSATVSSRLDDVVMRTLEKDPGRRFQQASQIKSACESLHANTYEHGDVPYVEEATAANQFRASTESPTNDDFSTSPICQPFPVTIEDIFASLAAGYGMMRGYETHLELEYEIRDAIVDHKWASQTVKIPLKKIDWIRIHKGLIYTYLEIQADHVDAVNELPNSKHGLFRVYLKKAHRESADQLVGYVQGQLGQKFGNNRPAPPIKSGGNAEFVGVYEFGSSPIAISLVIVFVIFLVLLLTTGLVWVMGARESSTATPVEASQVQVQQMEQMPEMPVMQQVPEMPRMKTMERPGSPSAVFEDKSGNAKASNEETSAEASVEEAAMEDVSKDEASEKAANKTGASKAEENSEEGISEQSATASASVQSGTRK